MGGFIQLLAGGLLVERQARVNFEIFAHVDSLDTRYPMCSRALWTVLPCGSSTAFFGVMMIFAFMRDSGAVARMLGKGNRGG